jgi:hypothetical protein
MCSSYFRLHSNDVRQILNAGGVGFTCPTKLRFLSLSIKLNMNKTRIRTAVGMFFSPLLLAVIWSIPYLEHSAFTKWLVINTIFAYLTFTVAAGISHLIIKALRLASAWQYCLVMFCVALVVSLGFSFYGLQGYNELYHSQTQVIKDGSITSAGLILEITNATQTAALFAAAFLLFWFISIRRRTRCDAHS